MLEVRTWRLIFGQPFGAEEALGFLHQVAAEAALLVIGGDGEVVDPAAVAFVADHDGGDELPVELTDEEEIGADFGFALDVFARVVLRFHEAAAGPEVNHGGFVGAAKGADREHRAK